MGGEIIVGLVSALVGGAVTLSAALFALPKIRAEARKLEAEASRTEWQTLKDEIDRLNDRASKQDARIADLEAQETSRSEREKELRKENHRLRNVIAKHEARIKALEGILAIGPLPADMKAALDRLDKLDGGK